MPECVCLARCPFFNDKMQDIPAMLLIYKEKYCLGDNEQCARHMVFQALGRERVPVDLYPNQQKRALKIIAGG